MKVRFKKENFLFYPIFIAVLFFASTNYSCSPKTGCPINEEAHVKPNKKGELPSSRGRSELFPKKMRKKM